MLKKIIKIFDLIVPVEASLSKDPLEMSDSEYSTYSLIHKLKNIRILMEKINLLKEGKIKIQIKDIIQKRVSYLYNSDTNLLRQGLEKKLNTIFNKIELNCRLESPHFLEGWGDDPPCFYFDLILTGVNFDQENNSVHPLEKITITDYKMNFYEEKPSVPNFDDVPHSSRWYLSDD